MDNLCKVNIIETGDYMELSELFSESGLEINIVDNKPPAMVTCWKAVDENDVLLGGVSIEFKGDKYVIGDIAVRKDIRNMDIGTKMVSVAIERIKSLGGKQIYIVAKAPKFFEKFGFTYLTEEAAPHIFNCKTCNQRGVNCFPEFMILEIFN